jgi:HAD superfamily hydrolase (TIGR01509 family)
MCAGSEAPIRPGPSLRAVLFDWDGTLLDSAELSYRCYVRVFEHFGIRFGREDFARGYSPDWIRTYERVGLPRTRWDEADGLWLRLYSGQAGDLLPGACQLLGALQARDLRLGVVTSGDRDRVHSDLARLGLAARFDAVVCGNDVPRRKPHPDGLIAALAQLGVEAQNACYVGDSPEDVEMARAASVFSIGIPGGFPNAEALAAARPDRLARCLFDVFPLLFGETEAARRSEDG